MSRRQPKVNKHGEEIHAFLVRIPASLDERLSNRAKRDGVSKSEITRRAIALFVK